MNIFVGNLSFDSTDRDVMKAFARFGSVASCVIVKDKKGRNSRGFGFVEMLDDKSAYAAIAALDGKEFMGRALNVAIGRPKTEKAQESVKKKSGSAYKQGRRSKSFLEKRAAAGITEPLPRRKKFYANPMRWRKKPRPAQKSRGESKPWEKTEAAPEPRKQAEGHAKPWEKRSGESKPWRKNEAGFEPRARRRGQSRPWAKAEKEIDPKRKPEEQGKPSKKTEGEPKPWRKSIEHPQQRRFTSRKKPGGYKR